jgi:DNA primase
MTGRIPREFIQELLVRVDLVELIDSRVSLRKSGNNFVARCPFHDEKTPSFSVSREKQFYHCFGCGAKGNAISFLMDYDHLSFLEAVEVLADSLGLKIPRESLRSPENQEESVARQIYEIQDLVAKFYYKQLKDHPGAARAVTYLKNRGISGEIAQKFRLGYAPPGWHHLPVEFSREILESAGLLIHKDGKYYDRFRDRIIFPIRDRRGRAVGFGGRVLGDETPKYLNSPESPVFKKHREVFGLYELLQACAKPRSIIVVEGYMDVIALVQFGIPNVVATLGTSTSQEHVELLFRYTNELIFCFDGDAAGQKAAWKALEACLPVLWDGRQIRFLVLPEKHDPDSIIRANGTQDFIDQVEKAQPFSDYFFGQLMNSLDMRTIEGRAALVKNAKVLIDKLPTSVFREMIGQRLKELASHEGVETTDKSAKLWETGKNKAPRGSERPSLLRVFLALLLQNPSLASDITDETRKYLASVQKRGNLLRLILKLVEERPNLNSALISEFFRGMPEKEFVDQLIGWDTYIAPDCVRTVFQDTVSRLERKLKEERLDELFDKEKKMGLSLEEEEELRALLKK